MKVKDLINELNKFLKRLDNEYNINSDFYLKIGDLVKLGSNLIKKNDMTLLYENT